MSTMVKNRNKKLKIAYRKVVNDKEESPQANEQRFTKTKQALAEVYLKSLQDLEKLLTKGID